MSDHVPPIAFHWDGEALVPVHPRLADKHYVVGERYTLVPYEDRSAQSHNHFFAAVAEAHNNLSEELALQFPTPDHLRKYALIKGGFHNSRSYVAQNDMEARRIAAFLGSVDEFSIVTVDAAVVTVYTAKTQKTRGKDAMDRKTFQASKDAVLTVISNMIGVDTETLMKNAGRAA